MPTTAAWGEEKVRSGLLTEVKSGSYLPRYGSCTLPGRRAPVSTPQPTSSPAPALLIVEDDRLLRWSLREKFATQGWKVLEADSGFAGLAAAGPLPIALALVAVTLPDIDGAALASRLAAAHPECRIVLMGSAERPEAVAPRSTGWPVLEKPFDLDELVRWAARAAAGTG
jgi:DNA-binding NtrC family response regulator